ncbi:hypothetical protein AB9K35_19090 [Leisingera sp. XS_AS12]
MPSAAHHGCIRRPSSWRALLMHQALLSLAAIRRRACRTWGTAVDAAFAAASAVRSTPHVTN